MKILNFLPGQVFTLNQLNFSGSVKAFNVCLCEPNIKVLNQSPLSNFSSFHSLLRDHKSGENGFNVKKVQQRKETESSKRKVSQSNEEKKKNKVKSLTMKPEIDHHDFQIKLKHLQKFVEKGMPVLLKVDNSKNLEGAFEKIFNQIQKYVTEKQLSAKVTQAGGVINIYPISSEKNQNKNENNNSSNLTSETKNKS